MLDNNSLTTLISRAPTHIAKAIQSASQRTGVDFAYLMEKAAAESNFKTNAQAKTSSATGLFQFIESTWLDMVKRYGSKYGINTEQNKNELLELRKDPKTAAFMAAEFANENKNYLQKHLSTDIGTTELYFAHFMGAGGATGFLKALKDNPLSIGADLFPKEAKANRGVFYDSKTGEPRSLQQIYAFFDKKFSNEAPQNDALPQTMAHKTKPKSNHYPHIPSSFVENPIDILPRSSLDRLASILFNHENDIYAEKKSSFLSTGLNNILSFNTAQLLLLSDLKE